ncbi:Hsp70 family protein [Natrialbaceae archaeon A-CW1-1]
MGITVGIDLGTTNSVVAFLNEDGDPEVVKNSNGNKKTPSVVQFRSEETVVGEAALNQGVRFPDSTARKVKRHMGDDTWTFETENQQLRPEGISSLVLEKLVKDVEDKTGEEVDGAVITVPADFSISERKATQNAAEIAGVDVIRLMNEPTAACLRYGIEGTDETILVYDLGGGTFDVTVVNITEEDGIVVDGSRGAQRLGGEDFDEMLYQQIILPNYIEQIGEDPNEEVEWELQEQAKSLKEMISTTSSDYASHSNGFDLEVTREEFEEVTENIIEDTIDTIEDLFGGDNVDSTKDDIDRVLLVGGSTRIPAVQERVQEYFGMEPSKELDLDLVVAEGAAIATDPDSLPIDIDGSGRGGSGEGNSDTRFVDVIARTIGVEVKGNNDDQMEFDPILERDVEVPAKSKGDYTTTKDNQPIIEVNIFEGDSDFVADNDKLGSFTLEDISPAAAGEPHFLISFEIDEDGVLQAEAEDTDTGEKANTTLEIGLSQKEIDREIQKIKSNVPAVR